MHPAARITEIAVLLLSVGIAAFAFPLDRFGEPLSNIAWLVGPQVVVLSTIHFLPPKSPPAYLAGASLATFANLLGLWIWARHTPPDNFMVVLVYWFALGATAAFALGFRALLGHVPRLSSAPALLTLATFAVCLAGGTLFTHLVLFS